MVAGEIDYNHLEPSMWLPTSVKEVEARGWDYLDVIIFSGDAYVDHPSFAAAVIGRALEAAGFRVAIVPQPNWRDDLRDFRKLGRPRLFFGVSAGAMDSMVNRYTANRRRRSEDAYTPDGRSDMRPDYPTIVYSETLRKLFPDVPIVAGGIEASLRRFSHYDYWQDRLRPSILVDTPADMLCYGMGERTMTELARRMAAGEKIQHITDLRQTVIRVQDFEPKEDADNIILASYDDCRRDKKKQSTNFRHIEQQSNRFNGGATLWQRHGAIWIKANPMLPAMAQGEIDATFDLSYTRLPHPRYRGKRIPAYEMIRHSVNLHRGCFGGCAFCTISAHQGKFIASRSKESILREVRQVTRMPDFKGYISDLGGPSANMYAMGGKDKSLCARCLRPSCLHPKPCPNLNRDHSALLDIYHAVDAVPGVKKSFIGSGVRYDLSMLPTGCPETDAINRRYNEELIRFHVSGRLKVAPEHTSDAVLSVMRKPPFALFHEFNDFFNDVNTRYNLRQQLIPYFISSHPGCRETDMAELAAETKDMNFHLEQVQDFTPTPMTVATEIYYSGYHPYTGEKIFTAIRPDDKLHQRMYFFWYDREQQGEISHRLHQLHRPDLIRRLFGSGHNLNTERSVQSNSTGKRHTRDTHTAKNQPGHNSSHNPHGRHVSGSPNSKNKK